METEPAVPELSDGIVTIRAPSKHDLGVLVEGRDAEFYRWLAAEEASPPPVACIQVSGQTVGWVDYDTRRPWLEAGEVNIGYFVFASHRGHGYVTRAMRLLLSHLSSRTGYTVATFAIADGNARSVAVAERLGAAPAGSLDNALYFKLRFSPAPA